MIFAFICIILFLIGIGIGALILYFVIKKAVKDEFKEYEEDKFP